MKIARPWYRKNRGWFVTLYGKQIPLGNDEKEAEKEYKRILSVPPAKVVKSESVAVLIDKFLDYVQKHLAPDTYVWYQSRLQLFDQKYPDLMIDEFIPNHVQEWIDGYKVSKGTKRNYARSIQRCMKWCEEQGLIVRSPIAHFKKPRGGIREIVISPDDYQTILANIRRRPFRDLCSFAWETGARATECLKIERRHLDLAKHRVLFKVEEEKMQRVPRIIYLTEESEAILRRLAVRTPKGRLFRNTDGEPWTTDAVNCAFLRLEKKMKIKYCLTAFRHSFIHRKLTSGVDALTVSVLCGHVDTTDLLPEN